MCDYNAPITTLCGDNMSIYCWPDPSRPIKRRKGKKKQTTGCRLKLQMPHISN